LFAGDEDDDAFLNAALAKARRIQRLKELNDSKPNGHVKTEAKGEAAVLQAIEKMKKEEATASGSSKKSNGGITFENDEIQEFTRALRAREDQIKRAPEKSRGVKSVSSGDALSSRKKKEADNALSKEGEEVVEDIDMEELANEMEHEDNDDTANDDNEQGGFGSTAGSAPIGRGMSSFLALLKQTGEIKHSGREEMRGRAKDKRTYEDYDHLNLKEVVKIDTRFAQDKDIELASREVKLEYRDDYGRLLTRKEAYRNMCYQFHGHGSSKKNQERRLRQIEREREEVKLASRQDGGAGTLGALKATQKATGKAFIIHKTS
jgi:U4/U6.U5 tri-snRNP-associated protein 1